MRIAVSRAFVENTRVCLGNLGGVSLLLKAFAAARVEEIEGKLQQAVEFIRRYGGPAGGSDAITARARGDPCRPAYGPSAKSL